MNTCRYLTIIAFAAALAWYALPAQPTSAAEFASDYWIAPANMPTARYGLATVTAANGLIYALGGEYDIPALGQVEAYNPATETWSTALQSMPTPRAHFGATLGPDGRIYTIGGSANDNDPACGGPCLKDSTSVEAFDPTHGTWDCSTDEDPTSGCSSYDLPPLPVAIHGLAAATDGSGTIYAIGGCTGSACPTGAVYTYTPGATSWTAIAPLTHPRFDLAAATGHNGDVYAIGGDNSINVYLPVPDASVEEYSRSQTKWINAAPLLAARDDLAAATASDGLIYAIGGGGASSEVDTYDSTTNSWSRAVPLTVGRYLPGVAAGSDGAVYAIGGSTTQGPTGAVEAHYPQPIAWSEAPSLVPARYLLAAAGTSIGGTPKIFAIGGRDASGNPLSTVETYSAGSAAWSSAGSLPQPRDSLAATAGNDGTIYAIGGLDVATGEATVYTLPPSGTSWLNAPNLPNPVHNLAAATGIDGTIYAIGGFGPSGATGAVEAFNPSTQQWTAKATMPTARSDLAAATGADGTVYAIGGLTPCTGYMCHPQPTAAVEAYTPQTNSWRTVAPLPMPLGSPVAVTEPNGDIYVFGSTVTYRYRPSSNTWATVPAMPTSRNLFAAAVGAGGAIYMIGGSTNTGALSTVEIYQPTISYWTCSTSATSCPPVADRLSPIPTPRSYSATTAGADGTI